ncbi:aldehyde dehydrogenase family protein [Streptomyces sp. NBC_00083]|uniref:aldehyde dehydrogenase family protein n=1 Tax=Streptomyces sp. NBC_00083 TaxID=2975647 RepID=UPI002255B84E|nr:aldehyde dehydrogenase family protein [Streptomyces sp. NBC_00083]MCX5388029.1 aldehyde dehydrogenase family protein [Streptomyces sp. NBC_00083]
MLAIDPFVAGESRPSADRAVLRDVHGEPLADVGLAPRLAAQAAVDRLRRLADGLPPEPEVFRTAARLFATAELDGESPDAYVHRTVRGTGLASTTVRRALTDMATEIEALPAAAAAELPAARLRPTHRVHRAPSGRIFTAVMASNHPLPHATWVQPLYHGYSVVVRPGSRDPFTPRRLAAALLTAGLPPEKLALLPSPHAVGSFLLNAADRGIVYGNDQAVSAWADHARVATRGPGRSRALLDAPLTDALLDHLALSAAFDGGTRCTNLSAVLTSNDVHATASALAERLARIPVLPALDPRSELLVVGHERADALRRQMAKLATELGDHSTPLYGDDFLVDLGDGSFLPRPMVLAADRADHPAVGTELAFPFVVVAPWSPADGIAPLRPSLVLNLLTDNAEITGRALLDPSVRKITDGAVLPWEPVPGMPHDGNYTAFLLDAKGVVTPAG